MTQWNTSVHRVSLVWRRQLHMFRRTQIVDLLCESTLFKTRKEKLRVKIVLHTVSLTYRPLASVPLARSAKWPGRWRHQIPYRKSRLRGGIKPVASETRRDSHNGHVFRWGWI
jgi:hypothetical protein